MNRLLGILAFTQVVSWGSTYYAIAVLSPSIGNSLQLSEAWVMGAFSAALLLSGLAAPWAGRWLDRHGGRRVMAAGSLTCAAGLAMLATATSTLAYYAAWCVIGVAMALTLYEAAFATIHQAVGDGAKQAISTLTLFGGFASTLFWPLTHALDTAWGWRTTLLLFALLQLLACLPLHLLLPRHRLRHATAASTTPPPKVRSRGFLLLAAAFSLSSFVYSAMSVHLIGLFHQLGHSMAAAVTFAALIGPMQVGGRLLDRLFSGNLTAGDIGSVALLALPVSIAILLGQGGMAAAAILFCILYGASNGVMTIVRGALPREWFGREHYGAVAGMLAAPSLIFKALGPLAISFALGQGATSAHILALLLLVSAAAFALYCLSYALLGQRQQGAKHDKDRSGRAVDDAAAALGSEIAPCALGERRVDAVNDDHQGGIGQHQPGKLQGVVRAR